jgi:hypothetical protein
MHQAQKAGAGTGNSKIQRDILVVLATRVSRWYYFCLFVIF